MTIQPSTVALRQEDGGTSGSCRWRAAARFAPPDLGSFTRRTPLETQVEYGLAPWKAKRLQRYIDENLGRGISNRALAALVDLSVSHLSRAFRTTFGDPPHAYVLRRRVERAKAMMLETGETLSQIAVLCGFADQAHFCRQFRRHTGLSPKRWMGRRLEPGGGTALC